MRVKIYSFKEEIEVHEDQCYLTGRIFNGYPINLATKNDPLECLNVIAKQYPIHKFWRGGWNFSSYVIINEEDDLDSLEKLLDDFYNVFERVRSKTEELNKIKNLSLFQRIFQWKKYTNT